MTVATVHGFGALAVGAGAVAPAYPANIAADDLALLICESQNSQAIGAVTGYTELFNLESSVGATRLTILYRLLDGGETAPTVPDPGDHVAACIGVFRGVDRHRPFYAVATHNHLGTTATPALPGMLTQIPDILVVQGCAYGADNSAALASGFTNASLANAAENIDGGTTDGNGGGLVVYTATKLVAGMIAPTVFTSAVGALSVAAFTIALRPATDVVFNAPTIGSPYIR